MLARISGRYAIIAIILAVFGGLVLTFGKNVGFTEFIRGGIAGFVFALIPVTLHMGYDTAKNEHIEEQRKQGIFKGIYLEILGYLEYVEYVEALYEDSGLQVIPYIPPLSQVAWNTAYASGYIKPDDKFCYNLRQIYGAMNTFVYLINQAIDARVKSTLPRTAREALVSKLIKEIRDSCRLIASFGKEAKGELEKRLAISDEEVNRLHAEVNKRIDMLRLTSSQATETSEANSLDSFHIQT